MGTPLETIEDGDEGIGEDEVIVDEGAIRGADTIGDAPTQGLARTGKNLRDAVTVLKTDNVRVR